jgi:hypothetical protein
MQISGQKGKQTTIGPSFRSRDPSDPIKWVTDIFPEISTKRVLWGPAEASQFSSEKSFKFQIWGVFGRAALPFFFQLTRPSLVVPKKGQSDGYFQTIAVAGLAHAPQRSLPSSLSRRQIKFRFFLNELNSEKKFKENSTFCGKKNSQKLNLNELKCGMIS